MFRNLVLLSTLFFLGNHAIGQSLKDISFGTDSTLEVVTWNIEWFPKNGASTIDSVEKIIKALDVDLIALQEISDTAAFRQMVYNLPDFEFLTTGGFTGGLAYVYKSSSISVQSISKIFNTSADRNLFPRPPAVLKFSYEGESFVAINNHFKCCGNGFLDFGNTSDEEFRRLGASDQLKQHIEYNLYYDKVIVLGDLNDLLTDAPQHNVFRFFINDSANYKFVDMPIAEGPASNWSFPNWPSHLDHILITSELFVAFANAGSSSSTIRVDDYMTGGFNSYDAHISDHRPVALKLNTQVSAVGIEEQEDLTINVHPNPTTGQINVQLSNYASPVEIKVYDVYGKLIFNQQNVREKSNLTITEAPGVYFIVVKRGASLSVKRIVKF